MTRVDGELSRRLAQRFEAVDSGQPDVEEHEVIGGFGNLLQALFAARNGFGGEAFVFEDAFQRLPDTGLVVDNEDSWHTGSSITKRVPRGKFGSTPM